MKWAMLLVAVVVTQAAGPPEVETLLRRGARAMHAGDLATAQACFEQAQERATDPRLVAFNLATVYYQQARAGQLSALGSAEVAYRSCLERDDVRRAEAFFGLGNCLLLRGTSGKLDALALRAAIDRYTECLREPGASEALLADARHNQERARLLLMQAPTATGEAPEQNSGEEPNQEDPQTPRGEEPRRGAAGAGEPERGGERGKAGARERGGERGDGRPSAGRGTLPPVPDRPDAPPLAGPDAVEHLERAWKMIQDDLVNHRRGRARPGSAGVRDW